MISIVLQAEFSRRSDIISFHKLGEINAFGRGLKNASYLCNYRHERGS